MNKDLHLLGQLTTELLINAEEFGDGCLGTAGTLVPEDVEMLTRVEAFCQEPKIWVVAQDEVVEGEINDRPVHIFFNRADALADFNSTVSEAKKELLEYGWTLNDEYTDGDDHLFFEAWMESEAYSYCHYRTELYSVNIK
jgi:hypothetical protein